MIFEKKIDELLQMNLTNDGFVFWSKLKNQIPSVWDKPTSSSGKYHRREDGRVPSIAEHTYEMLAAAIRIIELFGFDRKTTNYDLILLAIALHDAFKYGKNPEGVNFTTSDHDRIIGNTIRDNKHIFLKIFSESQVDLLENMVRFHSGRWSTDHPMTWEFRELNSYTMFVHMLDMLSSKNLLKIGDQKNGG